MNFIKAHGLGNDFVLVDAREERELPVEPEQLRNLAVDVCHRNFGIGADGLVLIKQASDADVFMQIINSDGSEAEMCGNAIRCVAKYVYEKGQIQDNYLRIQTLAGIMIPEVVEENGKVTAVRVDMGEPVLERAQIPMLGEPGPVVDEDLQCTDQTFRVTAVSMGNPHCVIFVKDIDQVPLELWGRCLETHPSFPGKTNVEFVQIFDRKEIAMKVWERGAGATLSCGTGACASAVAGVLNGLTNRQIRVNLNSGHLLIEWNEKNNHVFMTGPAEFVFKGDYPL